MCAPKRHGCRPEVARSGTSACAKVCHGPRSGRVVDVRPPVPRSATAEGCGRRAREPRLRRHLVPRDSGGHRFRSCGGDVGEHQPHRRRHRDLRHLERRTFRRGRAEPSDSGRLPRAFLARAGSQPSRGREPRRVSSLYASSGSDDPVPRRPRCARPRGTPGPACARRARAEDARTRSRASPWCASVLRARRAHRRRARNPRTVRAPGPRAGRRAGDRSSGRPGSCPRAHVAVPPAGELRRQPAAAGLQRGRSHRAGDRLVDAIVAWGDEEAIARRVREHRQAGANHVCVQVLASRPEEARSVPTQVWRRLAPALLAEGDSERA